MDILPRVKSVTAGKKGWVLDVVWFDNGKTRVDLTGLVHRSKHFHTFVDNPKAFQNVAPVNFGSGIGWENGLDYSAATLRTLAEEQRPMKGKDLAAFEQKYDLNTAEMAALLEIAERTVRAYKTADALPTTIAMSLRSLDADPARFAAHFRPIERRNRGRPRKAVRA
jgi:DNA-binding transcriptional regulator YiaG